MQITRSDDGLISLSLSPLLVENYQQRYLTSSRNEQQHQQSIAITDKQIKTQLTYGRSSNRYPAITSST
ncbi:hypothetical protein RHGRI_020557 [Rhododendron griersonianum]|uniref:Uncharacterized protein n=1 Tax=Rhododendron griersonianum TaxID=479676 RepID=A0AAV6JGN9_9ERIC|nr:hypothetical protein RHGRI_020557 [Rhododendron griersonianum]